MEFGLSEIQSSLQDSINRYLEENASLEKIREFADSDASFDQDIWSGLVELGVPGILVPEEYGGIGLGALDAVAISECLGYHVAPVPFFSSSVMAASAIQLCGSDTQKNEYLPRLSSGELTVGIGLAELTGRRKDAGITSSGSRLSGTALFVLDPDADCYLVADDKARLYLVKSGNEGISLQSMPQVDRTRKIAALDFENVESDPLIGTTASGIQHLIDLGRVILSADSLGASQAMLDKAVAYAMEREQFNRVIASFQAVKHMCAEMAAEIEPARSLVWYAGHALDEVPDEKHLTACHAKAHLAEVATFVGRTATIVHGGMGFTDLLGLHYWFKRIGFNRQYLGGPEFVREEAARTQGLVV